MIRYGILKYKGLVEDKYCMAKQYEKSIRMLKE